MKLDRRSFLGGAFALGALSGCNGLSASQRPDLRLGVVSDIHVMTPETTEKFRLALKYFLARGVDAVVVPGDLGDWGLRSNFVDFKAAWDAVMAGTGVVPLFCTGNHDYDGYAYGDMTVEMHALGYSEKDAIVRNGGMKKCWEEIFCEPFEEIRCRTVRGFDFISCEYKPKDPEAVAKWFAAHGDKYADGRTFFYFQHVPLNQTPVTKAVLDAYPNCVALTGHEHTPFYYERCLRQDKVTEINVPSLSYTELPGGRENGPGPRDGTCTYAMQALSDRFNLHGDQGYVITVCGDEMVVERREIVENCNGAPDWVVPLARGVARPYERKTRVAAFRAPQFPSGAQIAVDTRNATNRKGKWIAAMRLRFPTALPGSGLRAFDYEVTAVLEDGSVAMTKRFYSPAVSRHPRHEPKEQCFWFDVADLPQDVDYVLKIRPRNCFGTAGVPIVTGHLHSQPGLAKCTEAKS